jgi:hypothetical protein
MFADLILPDTSITPISVPESVRSGNLLPIYVDVHGQYGPAQRAFFYVKNEIEILNLVAIAESMDE